MGLFSLVQRVIPPVTSQPFYLIYKMKQSNLLLKMGWINQSRAFRLIDFIKSIKKKNGDQINHKSLLNLYLRNKTQTRLSIFVISDSQHHKIQNRKRKHLQDQHWGRKHFLDSVSDCKCAKSDHIKSKWTSWLENLKLVGISLLFWEPKKMKDRNYLEFAYVVCHNYLFLHRQLCSLSEQNLVLITISVSRYS